MNVLIVDEEVPYPLNTGKRLRTYNLIRRLQEQHKITYLCYGDGITALPGCPNVDLHTLASPVIEQKGIRFYGALLGNLLSSKPYIVDRHFSADMSKAVRRLVETGTFDLIHCEWTPYTESIRQVLPLLPSVLSAHNVEARIWERYYSAERNPLKKAYIGIQWEKLRRYEREAGACYTEVVAVSEPDKLIFEQEYGCQRVHVVANGVDESYFSPQSRPRKPASMVFSGSMDWRPNQDGARYFIEEILPSIRKRVPQATFTVVGRKPPTWLTDMASSAPGITVTGTVDDVRPFVAESLLYVVPLRVGGGSRLKILEALSMEMPVLSTTVGAEGLDLVDGQDVILRDDPSSFAETAADMLQQPEHWSRLGKGGRRLILERYTWDSIATVMDHVWRRAVAHHA